MTGWSCNKVKSPFIHQRTWPRICIPGNIRENLLMVQWNEIFHGEPSASSHPARKDWGEDGRGNHWNSFFFSCNFPSSLQVLCQQNPTAAWEAEAQLSSLYPKAGLDTLQEIQSKPHPHIFLCAGKGRKEQKLYEFGKDAQSSDSRTPWKKQPGFYLPGRRISIILHFQALKNYFQAFEGNKIMPWVMAKLF